MDPAPTQRGLRLSSLALAGIILLSVLLGCMFGALLGGAGGFFTASTMANNARNQLQQQVNDLQTQLNATQNRPAPTQPPAAPKSTSPTQAAPGAAPKNTTPTQAAPGAAPKNTTPTQAAPGAAPKNTTPQAPPGSQPAPTVYLGVRYLMLTPELSAQLGITITQGAAISEVIPASPAEAAGLEPGDIITAMDGRPITDSFPLADAVLGKRPGDVVEFTVLREDRTITLRATLAAPPAGVFNTPTPGAPGAPPAGPTVRPPGGTAQPTVRPPGGTGQPPAAPPQATPRPGTPAPGGTVRPPSSQAPTTAPLSPPNVGGTGAPVAPAQRAYLGVQVAPVTDAIAKAAGLPQASGVVIERVTPSSPAFQAGLFDGDLILAVNGTSIDANHSLTSLLAARKPGDKVTLRVVRSGKTEDLAITLGATTAEFNEGRPGGP